MEIPMPNDVESVNNRRELLDRIGVEGRVCAEVGVCSGDYSSEIRKRKPKLLYLIDSWAFNERSLKGGLLGGMGENGYLAVRLKFGKDPSVVIVRKTSFEASLSIPERSLDLVYIDADHSFEYAYADLLLWYPKLKRGGWLTGHDYERRTPEWGVRRAVDIFLLVSEERVRMATCEARPTPNSFAIQKTV